jgi:hypothetical protein
LKQSARFAGERKARLIASSHIGFQGEGGYILALAHYRLWVLGKTDDEYGDDHGIAQSVFSSLNSQRADDVLDVLSLD